jgi:hypothetical protein
MSFTQIQRQQRKVSRQKICREKISRDISRAYTDGSQMCCSTVKDWFCQAFFNFDSPTSVATPGF